MDNSEYFSHWCLLGKHQICNKIFIKNGTEVRCMCGCHGGKKEDIPFHPPEKPEGEQKELEEVATI